MAVIAVTSAKGSPGASTAALAFAMAWKSPTILAECDPAGGDLLSGYLGGLALPADRGLLQVAMADSRDNLAAEFWGQLVDLDAPHRRRLALPGISSPRQAATLRPTWPRLAAFFAGLEHADPSYDVIADCGRLVTADAPFPLFQRADLVLMTLRPASLRDVAPVWPALGELRRSLIEAEVSLNRLGLLLIGDGPYGRREIEQRLQCPVMVQLPIDRKTAAALSNGGRLKGSRDLLRHAASAEASIRERIASLRQHHQALAPGAAHAD
ncbi:MAG TPA: ParA family protein [Micromonosporaceae bacterium]|nr:ParA family protein [Micromonosporaceae bacterium]